MNTPENLLKNRNPVEFAEAAVVMREAAKEMVARLDWIAMQPERIVEVGCAVGDCTALLSARYPTAQITAFDADADMLAEASQKNLSNVTWSIGETHSLPLKEHSVDLLVANGVLPWCSDIHAVLKAWRRYLRPDGLLMFTSFGPDTLVELHEVPLPQRVDMHIVGDALTQAGYADPVMDVDYFTLTYRDREKLWHELKILGMVDGDCRAVRLEPNEENVFSLTYEVIFGHAWGPGLEVDHVADESGVVKIPISHILRRG